MFRQYSKTLTIVFLVTSTLSCVKCDEDELAVENLKENNLITCDKLSSESSAFKKCIVIQQALENLNKAFDSISKDSNIISIDDKELQQQVLQVTKQKLMKLRDLLNKMKINQGYSGMMQTFRVFGIPMSKLWALFILLDPFEI